MMVIDESSRVQYTESKTSTIPLSQLIVVNSNPMMSFFAVHYLKFVVGRPFIFINL